MYLGPATSGPAIQLLRGELTKCSSGPPSHQLALTNLVARRPLNMALSPMKAVLFASLAAIAVQPIVLVLSFAPAFLSGGEAAISQILGISLLAAMIAIPFVLFVGIPSFVLLRRYGRLSWLTLGATGLLAGILPVALYGPGASHGSSYGGNWHGDYVDFVVNGEPTVYGWLSYLQSMFLFGIHGLAGALVFLLVWRHCSGEMVR